MTGEPTEETRTLDQTYDALLFDLDGTLYRGPDPVEGAADVLRSTASTLWYVTNNASRSASDVATHLRDLGFDAADDTVVTSSQAAARLLATLVPAASSVLVVGTDALAAEIENVGLVPTRSADQAPAAVVQGHSETTSWHDLAEATYAIRAGATWVATNTDTTLPTPRGLGPGNGSMVAAVRTATGAEPIVAGKPAEPLMRDALERSGSKKPLVIGDRLDTDVAGAIAVQADSLLVLTGVSRPVDVLRAAENQRPTFLAADLSALHRRSRDSFVASSTTWSARVVDRNLVVSHTGERDPGPEAWVEALRAVAPVAWVAGDFDSVRGDDSVAEAVVARWLA